jgi:hypothetical protein
VEIARLEHNGTLFEQPFCPTKHLCPANPKAEPTLQPLFAPGEGRTPAPHRHSGPHLSPACH